MDIYSQILKQNEVQKNYEDALETIPESFIPVNMLYIPAIINKKEVDLFIDTGAQISLMSLEMAKNCGIDYLIDYFVNGEVKGIGKQDIIGKIHMVDVGIGDVSIPCGFTIINNSKDIILGLNMLLSHGCILDLKNKNLCYGNYKINFKN